MTIPSVSPQRYEHEAGHAVAAVWFGIPFTKVVVVAAAGHPADGYVWVEGDPIITKDGIADPLPITDSTYLGFRVTFLLAGLVSEIISTADLPKETLGILIAKASKDLWLTRSLLTPAMITWNDAIEQAARFAYDKWDAIGNVAQALRNESVLLPEAVVWLSEHPAHHAPSRRIDATIEIAREVITVYDQWPLHWKRLMGS